MLCYRKNESECILAQSAQNPQIKVLERTVRTVFERWEGVVIVMRTLVIVFVVAWCLVALVASTPVTAFADGGTLTGFAFVDSSVTGMGSRAKLPAGTKIYPPGSKITGTDGCPTNRYHTDGMIVAVIDYQGRPTAASVNISETLDSGGIFVTAPYYIDLNSGRTLQYLGPIFENGTYDVSFSYNYNVGAAKTASAKFALDRTCH